MDFELDDDQLALQDAVRDVVAKECPAAYVRRVVDEGHDPIDLWQTYVSLDWPALAVPEAHGGLGYSMVELAVVLEALGHAADPTPYLATTSQFVPVVRECATPDQAGRFLGAVARGERSGTLALANDAGRWDPTTTDVSATADGDGWRLTGTARYVIDGARADEIAVVTTTADGPAVMIVPGSDVLATPIPSFELTVPVADVSVDGVWVADDRRLGGDVATGLSRALEEAVTGLAVSTVGTCQRIVDLTLDYVKERHQFGVPIGSFQAMKHKMVDMYTAVERARALAWFAALTIAEDDPRRSLAAAMAKAAAGDCQALVFEQGFQSFGGIGYTWENDLQIYLKRAKVGELLFGGATAHRARVADQLLA